MAPASVPAATAATPAARGQGRRRLLVSGAVLVAVGLAVSTAGSGPLADALGDALYAALVWVLLALVLPRWGAPAVTLTAITVCWGIELAQLTGLPAAATAAWAPARYVLGTTFTPSDLVAYAVGAVAAGVAARGRGVGTTQLGGAAPGGGRAVTPRPPTGGPGSGSRRGDY
ncbi:DUF2809 domain-containing protein [Cellulomonas aerilata]|uniref:DUF2809 domain-containing protein n=1 Tax=Cellulomonas aerilata TaxID=515326 RepID=A0A512DED9_9CELL|nr:DUF2809 domain-containing protein [Cellulomonas aerilata]GEO34600.1 hypothetical protein CAE01nite_23250 [Cellulomonas aerilata]